MANYLATDTDLASVANAIRAKGGTSAQLSFPSGFVSAIGAIETGGGLNFDVVGGTTQPSSAAVNTIWVNTDTAITDWVLSPVAPATANEGTVWIRTSLASAFGFNALAENAIMVYPTDAQQYISGAWVSKDAKSFNGTAWVEWAIYLYNTGDECTDLTGGWGSGGAMSVSAGYTTRGTFTLNDTNIFVNVKIVGGGATGVLLSTVNKIDLSGYSKLCMVLDAATGIEDDSHGTGSWLVVRSSKTGGTSGWNPTGDLHVLPPGTVASQGFTEAGVVELDLTTVQGEYYVGLAMAGYSAKTATISAFYLIK